MSHTPGPWKVEGVTIIWSPSAKQVVAAVSALEPKSGMVEYERPGIGDLAIPPANARLIAAAPDLLAALEAMVEAEVDYMTINNLGDPEQQHNVKRARAAIAAAKEG